MEYSATNYNQLAPKVYAALRDHGLREQSRNGDVLRLPGVTTLVVHKPWERVNFSPVRDANPFFHLMEAMCMLANVNDAKFLGHFAKNMLSFSDDGNTFNAFYGERARSRWGDQFSMVIDELKANPQSRQCVVLLWDAADLSKVTKDKACNLMMLFSVSQQTGRLEMTTFNRSNDAIWGILTGANIVHFSFFQEYVALALGRLIGPWTHVSNNLHVYVDNPKWVELCGKKYTELPTHDLYSVIPSCNPVPMFYTDDRFKFEHALPYILNEMKCCVARGERFVSSPVLQKLPFLCNTVVPVFNAWQAHKYGVVNPSEAREITSPDWRAACVAWLERRAKK